MNDQFKQIGSLMLWATFQEAGKNSSIKNLKKYVNQLCTMTAQMTAGQENHTKKGYIPFENLERIQMSIVCEAVALVQSGRLDELEKKENKINE